MKLETLEKANELNKQLDSLEKKKSQFIEQTYDEETQEIIEEKPLNVFPDELFNKQLQSLFTETEAIKFNEFVIDLLNKKIKTIKKQFNEL